MYNKNRITMLDPRYEAQQKAIRTVCDELGLVVYLPSYHAAQRDSNTVLIYSKAAAEHNNKLDQFEKKYGYRNEAYERHICWLENSDRNGRFDLDFMNYGSLDLRAGNYEEVIGAYIRHEAEGYLLHNIAELHNSGSGGTEC